jgi:hypothetical protein
MATYITQRPICLLCRVDEDESPEMVRPLGCIHFICPDCYTVYHPIQNKWEIPNPDGLLHP